MRRRRMTRATAATLEADGRERHTARSSPPALPDQSLDVSNHDLGTRRCGQTPNVSSIAGLDVCATFDG
jgi:hypothetical protein